MGITWIIPWDVLWEPKSNGAPRGSHGMSHGFRESRGTPHWFVGAPWEIMTISWDVSEWGIP